jgi:multiple sugar transport system permease protein
MTVTTRTTEETGRPPTTGRTQLTGRGGTPSGPVGQRTWTRYAGYAVLIFFAVIYLMPFIIQLSTSFKTDADATNHPLRLWPATFSLDAYRTLANQNFPLWFMNSVIVAFFVTAGRVFLDSLAGYALARLKFPGRSAVFAGVIAVMAVPGVVLLIPEFLVLNQVGMYDHYTGMIIPLIADAAGVFIMRQFFLSIPDSIEEAARIDGAGTFRLFWSIVLPMAKPALITLPVALVFQKRFMRGATEGGVKG